MAVDRAGSRSGAGAEIFEVRLLIGTLPAPQRRFPTTNRRKQDRHIMQTMAESVSSPVLDYLTQLHSDVAGIMDGEVATYIPELANADPNWFGICLVTAGGHVYEVGDTGIPFTIQSISKPFVYGIALEDNGLSEVVQKVGVEPTGDAFNSISLEPDTGRPRNPMINAGAIATAGLVPGTAPSSRLRRVLDAFSTFAGRQLFLDETVYQSENSTGHRNRAIGHMLRNFDILRSNPDPTVELYFKQCSISVTCRDLGVMAATLANRGVNPVTGKQAVRGQYVENMLSVMSSCGMYDWAGEWIYNVGMPAKSGVAGGIIAVLPGQIGIGVFSPPLDSHGNSVRGIRVCEAISRGFDLHLFNRRSTGSDAIRLQFTGAQINSRRVRTPDETAILQKHGGCIRVYQLQGNLNFATTEAVAHSVMEQLEIIEHLVIDFGHVLSVNDPAARMLYEIAIKLTACGRTVSFTHTDQVPLLRRVFKKKLPDTYADHFRTFPENDPALEWCEDRLLGAQQANLVAESSTVAECELLIGLSESEIAMLATLLETRKYPAGAAIIQVGDEARELFILATGRVSVLIGEGEIPRRLATFSPGMVFGEVALIDQSPRSATIQADSEVECYVLSLAAFQQLGGSSPAIKIKLLENLSYGLCRKLRKANRELSVFDH